MKKPYYLHIDGMDLSGKTSICSKLRETLNGAWEIRTKSLSDKNSIYQLADGLRINGRYNEEVIGHLYVVALRSELFDFKWPTINTIQESTVLLRSLAFHTMVGPVEIPDLLLGIANKHPKFDASFVLTTSLETRLKRLQKRVKDGQVGKHDQLIIDDPAKFMKMEEHLVEYSKKLFNSTIIDTSSSEVADIVRLISQEIHL
jgi:thymidylate kinase